jgi:hypothetical protein
MLSDVLDFLFGFGSSYPGIRGFNATTDKRMDLAEGDKILNQITMTGVKNGFPAPVLHFT